MFDFGTGCPGSNRSSLLLTWARFLLLSNGSAKTHRLTALRRFGTDSLMDKQDPSVAVNDDLSPSTPFSVVRPLEARLFTPSAEKPAGGLESNLHYRVVTRQEFRPTENKSFKRLLPRQQ
jgi:hypothetical protein